MLAKNKIKAQKVIDSCNTKQQIRTAVNYCRSLLRNNKNPKDKDDIEDYLIRKILVEGWPHEFMEECANQLTHKIYKNYNKGKKNENYKSIS